jgi:hypothetical protein
VTRRNFLSKCARKWRLLKTKENGIELGMIRKRKNAKGHYDRVGDGHWKSIGNWLKAIAIHKGKPKKIRLPKDRKNR